MDNTNPPGMKMVKRLGMPGLFLLLALAVYSTILRSFFLSDDFFLIGRVLEGDFSITWGREHGGFFRPLLIFSYFIDSALWKTAPAGYHLTNILLHGLNSYVVFILAGRWTRTNLEPAIVPRVSAFAGLLFLLHPSHTEAVTWISGRADLLATLFSLLALVSFDSFKQAGRIRYLAGPLVLFMMALLAKESAVCLPLIIIALEGFSSFQRRQEGKLVDLKRIAGVSGLLGLTLGLYFVVRYLFLGKLIGGYGASHYLNLRVSLLWERLPKFAVRAFLPSLPDQLSFMLIKPFKSGAFILLAAFSIAAVAALVIHRRKLFSAAERKSQNAFLVLLVAGFLFALLPVITLGISVFDTLGERFVYLPSVFSAIGVAYVSVVLIPNPKAWVVLVLCVLIFYSSELYRSNQNWNRAAALSQSILHDLAESSTHNDILILNVPGSWAGVPIYRNGLEDAVRSFQHLKRIDKIEVLAYLDLPDKTGKLETVQTSESIEIRLLDEQIEFSQINRPDCVEIAEQPQRLLRIRLKDCAFEKNLFVFQDGRMRLIEAMQNQNRER